MLIECLTVFATTFLHEAVEMEIPRGLWNFKFYSSIHLYLLMKINGTYYFRVLLIGAAQYQLM